MSTEGDEENVVKFPDSRGKPENGGGSIEDLHLTTMVIAGYDKNGDFYMTTSETPAPELLWILERAKQTLLDLEGLD